MIELSSNISNYVLNYFGSEFLDKYKDFFNGEYLPSIRISPFIEEEKILASLAGYGIELDKIADIPNAFRVLKGAEKLGKTLEYTLGKYYIQSLSSMIPPIALKPDENDLVLDLCSAPGSKLTQLAEIMKNKGTLYSNEISVDRIKSLIYNIEKMNFTNVGVLNFKGEMLSKIYSGYFDKILVDAPCSGLGIVQKKGEVSNWWNETQAEKLSEIQFRLLVSALKMLKTGGEILYSTCTMTVEENEFVLDKFLSKYPVELIDVELPVKSIEAFTKIKEREFNPSIKKARRILPWGINSEGFFVAKLRKTGETEVPERLEIRNRDLNLISANNNAIKKHLQSIASYYGTGTSLYNDYKYIFKGSDIFFVNADWQAQGINEFLRVGTKLGSINKRGDIQIHTLAAQILGANFTQNVIELTSLEDLKVYMNGGTIKRDFGPTGAKVIRYKDYILGTAVNSKEGLKSQFPRALRTHEIILR